MSNSIDTLTAQNAVKQQEFAAREREIASSRRALSHGTDKSKEEKLRQACEGFESIFIQKMWEQMQATVPKEGYLHSKEEKFWQGMYDQELSKKMAGNGGVGLADMMMEQLGKNLQNVSRTTADSGAFKREPIPIEPVPLLPDAKADKNIVENEKAKIELGKSAEKAPKAMPDLYNGVAEQIAPVAEEHTASAEQNAGQLLNNQVPVVNAATEPSTKELSLDEFTLLINKLEQERLNAQQNIQPETQAKAVQPEVVTRVIKQPNFNKDKNIPRVPAGHPITGRNFTQNNMSPTMTSAVRTASLKPVD